MVIRYSEDEFSYYQDTTVMVIKYTDRNFPVGEEYKDNLYFILKREEDDQEAESDARRTGKKKELLMR